MSYLLSRHPLQVSKSELDAEDNALREQYKLRATYDQEKEDNVNQPVTKQYKGETLYVKDEFGNPVLQPQNLTENDPNR
jgi:hypothetical protein